MQDNYKIKYVQINDTNWAYAPQQNIYLSLARINKYVDDNNLKEKMKPIYRRGFDYDQQQIDLTMSCKDDNFGQLFYLEIENNFYFAWILNKKLTGNLVELTLQIDVITFILPLANSGKLKGTAYLEQGHLVEREKNTMCPPECSGMSNYENYYTEFGAQTINTDTDIFCVTNTQTTKEKKVSAGGGGFQHMLFKKLGTALEVGNNFLLQNAQSVEVVNGVSLKEREITRLEVTENFNIEKSQWGNGSNNIFTELTLWPNSKEADKNRVILESILDVSSEKWFCLPRIGLNVRGEKIEFFELKIPLTIFPSLKNHLWKHVEISFNIGNLFTIPINIFNLQKELFSDSYTIWVKRVVSSGGAFFYFYYNKKEKIEFHKINLSIENSKSTDKWIEYTSNRSASDGVQARTYNDILGGLSSLVNTGFSVASGSKFGIYQSLSEVTSKGFDIVKRNLQDYYNQLDVLKQRTTSTNLNPFELTEKLLLTTVVSEFDIYQLLLKDRGNPNDPNFNIVRQQDNLIFKYKKQFSTGSQNNIYSLQGKIVDKENQTYIAKIQKMKGNIINLELEIDNIFELTKKDYNYVKGILKPYNYNLIPNNMFNKINEVLLTGIVILNEANEWS